MANGKVTFRYDSCKGCGLCITACPKKIIFLDKTRINIKGYNPATIENMEECIGCGNCAQMCPDLIITVERLN
jgi:2-oxoglutarate ferredoxin oxidoreductase subunit delta